ncbi:hypothetical protein [Nonomuraea salmonea]|uniref:hypothetical protein n=1 Tax=Nonomuraea salmonea TaxID=46181 RepID=UPI0031E905B8
MDDVDGGRAAGVVGARPHLRVGARLVRGAAHDRHPVRRGAGGADRGRGAAAPQQVGGARGRAGVRDDDRAGGAAYGGRRAAARQGRDAAGAVDQPVRPGGRRRRGGRRPPLRRGRLQRPPS